VLGGKGQEYEHISSLANAAMNKIGQIRRTAKWHRYRAQIPLNIGKLCPAGIYARYLCHFAASNVYLTGPDPKA
jgi:hypothetical protein